MTLSSIEQALDDLRSGKMIILADDEKREHEGDLVIAAEKITPDAINFMTKQARGLVCLAITQEIVDRLQLPLMPERNKQSNQAAFTMSIEASQGVTTGISTQDRAKTIQTAIHPHAKPQDISMPGHVFPLLAKNAGVLERPGHTEGSVDLVKAARLIPAAVICEIMNDDGSMARLSDLERFSKQFGMTMVSINEVIDFRLKNEIIVEEISSAALPLKCSEDFVIRIFRDRFTQAEHIALIHEKITDSPLVRIHSECLTGDVLGSLRCDCGDQLNRSLTEISQEGGILLYMRQEGRGIGLGNKIKAYGLQSNGFDTVEANHQLGFQADHRQYGLCAQMLRLIGIERIQLITNNPNKIKDLENNGIRVTKRISLESVPNKNNLEYLRTKRDKLGHWLKLL